MRLLGSDKLVFEPKLAPHPPPHPPQDRELAQLSLLQKFSGEAQLLAVGGAFTLHWGTPPPYL